LSSFLQEVKVSPIHKVRPSANFEKLTNNILLRLFTEF
jgi:hypothetical protein